MLFLLCWHSTLRGLFRISFERYGFPRMDRLDKTRRSWNMGRIKGRNTAPEMAVRSLLHRAGYRFRLHRRGLPGRPDIVLPGRKTIIFVHGCFWHRHQRCKQCYTPKSNVDFWQAKFAGTIERDRRNAQALSKAGWKVFVVWECELAAPKELQARLRTLLESAR
jgi:DNA mismatch endonuclease, patch repair protein